jgi:hypothetical protein
VGVTCNEAVSNTITLSSGDYLADVTTFNATTCLSDDGYITISVPGNVDDYTYKVDGVAKTLSNINEITGLSAGNHVLTVTRTADDCSVSVPFFINNDASDISVTQTAIKHTTCLQSTGAITVTMNGTTSYQYQLD